MSRPRPAVSACMTGNPFNKSNYRALSADLAAALKPVGEKHGITFEIGGGSIDRSGKSASIKIAAAVSASGEPLHVILFKEHGASLGFKPEHLGATLTLRSRQFRLAGLMKKRDFSVLITRIPDGMEVNYPPPKRWGLVPVSALRLRQAFKVSLIPGATVSLERTIGVHPAGHCSGLCVEASPKTAGLAVKLGPQRTVRPDLVWFACATIGNILPFRATDH